MENKNFLKKVLIYTDGSSSGNPGPSGWCSIIIDSNTKKQTTIRGTKKEGTNNEMELRAVVNGLLFLTEPKEVEIYTDSEYVCSFFNNNLYEKWILNDWKGSKNQPIKHKELWLKLIKLNSIHSIKCLKVKAHSGDFFNTKCDKIAGYQSKRAKNTKTYYIQKKKTKKRN